LSQAEERVGPPLHVDLEATLEDLYNGRTLTVTQKKQVLCHRCRGTGAENPDEVTKCPVCGGSGVRLITQQLGPGFITQTQTTYALSLLFLPPHPSLLLLLLLSHCIANSAAAPTQL
jgi:DnaJ-class molecular chaperone